VALVDWDERQCGAWSQRSQRVRGTSVGGGTGTGPLGGSATGRQCVCLVIGDPGGARLGTLERKKKVKSIISEVPSLVCGVSISKELCMHRKRTVYVRTC
jgi:hypothetical protein